MSINAVRSGVASQIANYFSSNYEALLQSSAAQPPAPLLSTAPGSWLQDPANANKRFFLSSNGSITRLSNTASASEVAAAQANAVEVDADVAYSIENTGLSAVDWMMRRLADEFRLNESLDRVGSALTQTPEPEMNIDLSSLDTASLVRMLNMLLGRARSAQQDTAAEGLRGQQNTARLLGLSVQNLSNAVELQLAYQSNSTVAGAAGSLLSGEASSQRENITSQAMNRLVGNKTSELEGARMAFNQSAAGRLGNDRKLSRAVDITSRALDASLQGAADIALMQNPELQRFGSALDLQQTNDGLVVRTQSGQSRELQTQYVQQALTAALQDPQFRQDLIDALASQADALGLSDLDPAELQALLGEVVDAVIASVLADEDYLNDLASQSVQFHADISQLVSNEVEAARGRDGTPQNV